MALHARPAERTAVRVSRGECPIEVAVRPDEAQEVVEPLLARAGPERRVLQFGLVAERVESDATALARDPGITRLVGVHAIVDVAEEHTIEREALLGEDRYRVLSVDREVSEDRHAGGKCGARGGPVDALVEVGHPASPADAHLDHAGEAAGVADAHGDLVHELSGQVLDARAGEEGERGVATDESRACNDVHAGLGREGLVVVDVPAVADARGIHESTAAALVKLAEFGHRLGVALLGCLPPPGVELGAGHPVADVLMDGDEPEFLGGDRAQNGIHSRHG